jgi:hypothetical protein
MPNPLGDIMNNMEQQREDKAQAFKKFSNRPQEKLALERLEMARTTLSTMRTMVPTKYKYIMSLHSEPERAILKYQSLFSDEMNKAQEMYYELEEHNKRTEFSEYVFKQGIYKRKDSFRYAIEEYPFRIREDKLPSLSALHKFRKINELYTEWRKDNL